MRALLLLLLAAPAFSAPAQTPYPMFRGNAQHASSATVMGAIGNPRILWSRFFSTGGDYGAGVDNPYPLYGPTLGPDGVIFLPVYDRIYAIEPSTGGIKWMTAAAASGDMSQPAVTDDGKVIYSSNNVVVAVSTDTGAPIWAIDPRLLDGEGGTPFDGGPPILGPDGIYIGDQADERVLGSFTTRVYKIDPSNGVKLWSRQIDTGGYGSGVPALSPDATKVYWRGARAVETAILDAATGVNISTHYPGGWSDSLGISVDYDGSAYFTSETSAFGGEYLLKMDLTSKTTIWASASPLWTGSPPRFSPVIGLNTLIASTSNGLRGINKGSGATAWSNFDGATNTGAPTLINNTTLYVDTGLKLSDYDPDTGTERWFLQYSFDGVDQKGAGGIAVSSNGVVYTYRRLGSNTRRLFAIGGSGASSVASSPDAGFMRYEGSMWVSTAVYSATKPSLQPADGATVRVALTAPLNVNYDQATATGTLLSNNDFSMNSAGQLELKVRADLNGLNHANWGTFAATTTVSLINTGSVATFVASETRVSTIAVSMTFPSIEDDGNSIVRVTTFTITAKDGLGNPVPNFPLAMDLLDHAANLGGLCGTPASITPVAAYVLTDGAGQATWVHRLKVAVSDFYCLGVGNSPDHFTNFQARVEAFALGIPSLVLDTRETRASSLDITYSTGTITPETRSTTMTVTVRDGLLNPVPYAIVALNNLPATPSNVYEYYFRQHEGDDPNPCGGNHDYIIGYTDAGGSADFRIQLGQPTCSANSDYDDYNDTLSTFPVFGLNVAPSSPTAFLASNFLDAFVVQAPTATPVGIPFVSTLTAVNKYGHPIARYTGASHPLVPLFAGTEVQGTGTLGTNSVSFAGSSATVVVSSQTYNKVEQIEIKISRPSDGKTGRSGPIDVTGPTAFVVHLPTSTATAGNNFSMMVEAVDALGRRVVGYTATLSLSALQAGNTAQAGAGILGTTNVNLPGNGIVTIAAQTYTKSESIKIRAFESATSIVGYSTNSLTLAAGTPTSLTFSANPQSTIAGVPSVLSTEAQDLFGNKVAGATVTFSVVSGSGVVGVTFGGGGGSSTQTVTSGLGQAQAFFTSTNTLSSQANLLMVQLGALQTFTTIYNSVLITPAGGAIVNLGDPRIKVDVPPNAWSFNIRMSATSKSELDATDLAKTTAAFAAQSDTFVSTMAAKFAAVLDTNPNASAGDSATKVTVTLPFTDAGGGNVSVGAYSGQGILVPFSVLRVFKLNQATSLFEMLLDGVNTADLSSRTVSAQVTDPNGIYAIGAPAFTPMSPTSSGTVTTVLAIGATAQVSVPFGAFTAATNLQVGVPTAASVPALPGGRGLRGTGLTVSIQTTNGLQPVRPITVTIGYRNSDVAGLNPDTLRIARYDPASGWVVLDSRVDPLSRQVVGDTDHFSLFQIVSVSPSATLSGGMAFPNPFRPSQGHTLLKFGLLPALAKVKIYTTSGRLLKELEADATGQILNWDARDRDGRKLPSGVYLALVEASGEKRAIKFAVQR